MALMMHFSGRGHDGASFRLLRRVFAPRRSAGFRHAADGRVRGAEPIDPELPILQL